MAALLTSARANRNGAVNVEVGLKQFLEGARDTDGAPMTRGIGDHFYTPGFWTAFTALAMKRGVRYADLKFSSSARQGYAEAIHLPVALGAEDCYPYSRVNEGRNYSGLVLLESADSTDAANSNVAGCVRNPSRTWRR